MKKSITLVLTILVVFLSGCRKSDHYQVYAVKYLDGSVGSASNVAMGADPNDLVPDPDLIIPGHDELVFSKFPKVADWIVKIEKK